MRRRHVWHAGEWRDVTDVPRQPRKTPYLVRDGMAPAVHPATGEMIDSKSAFRAITRANGLVEIGNDALPPPPAPDVVTAAEIAKAYSMVEQGYKPPPCEVAEPDTVIYT